MRRTIFFAVFGISLFGIFLFWFFRSRTSKTTPPGKEAAVEKNDANNDVKETEALGSIEVTRQHIATIDSPFLIVIRLVPVAKCPNKDNRAKEVFVRMDEDPQVEYKPQKFNVKPCEQAFVTVTVKKKGSGLASLGAYADGYNFYSAAMDVGFEGKVRLTSTAPLHYNEPGSLNVEVIGQDDKPLSFGSSVSVTLESVDALISSGDSNWSRSVTLSLNPGARSSSPFQIKSQNLYGGMIHLSTSLINGQDPPVILSQENHSFEVAPAWWIPLLLGIFGAVLYCIYSILSDDDRSKISQKIGTSIVAGAIAWLFAGFDLLGLKLDTQSLRTYAISGFLFSFLGVDVLLSKRFPRTIHPPKA